MQLSTAFPFPMEPTLMIRSLGDTTTVYEVHALMDDSGDETDLFL
jgi:hypothetical protein